MTKPLSSLLRPRPLLALLGTSLLLGCNGSTAPQADAPPFSNDISLEEIMESTVMPSADAFWKSTQVNISLDGEKSSAPSTDEEWEDLHNHVVTLAAVTNLLMLPDLKIAKDMNSDEHGEGELGPKDVAKLHKANLKAFQAHATALHAVALKGLAAVDKRDLDAILDIGGEMDAVCEACHVQFWYPNAAKPNE